MLWGGTSKMKEIGELLKAAREEKGLSLEEIQMITKIRLKHLKALETGDFDQIPGEVYVKGFMVNFAKTVGLDGEKILEKYYELKNQEAVVSQEEELVFPEIPNVPEEVRGKTRKKPVVTIGIVSGILIIAGALFFIFNRPQSSVLVTEQEPVIDQTEVEIKEEPVLPLEKQDEVVKEVEPILIAEAKEVVWLGLYKKNSGEIIFEGTLYPNDRQEWLLTEDVLMRIGNAGGLKLIYKEKDLGELGYSGQVLEKVFFYTD